MNDVQHYTIHHTHIYVSVCNVYICTLTIFTSLWGPLDVSCAAGSFCVCYCCVGVVIAAAAAAVATAATNVNFDKPFSISKSA